MITYFNANFIRILKILPLMKDNKLIRAGSLTVFVFGLLGWLYIAAVALVHPQTLDLQLTHFTPWLREDTFGILSFIASFFAFFIYNYKE
jgi:hypothetical protein